MISAVEEHHCGRESWLNIHIHIFYFVFTTTLIYQVYGGSFPALSVILHLVYFAVLHWISNFGIEAMFWDQIPIFDNLSSIDQL